MEESKRNKKYKDGKNKKYKENISESKDFELEDDLIEGRNPCLEAIKAGRTINKIMIAKGSEQGSINKIVAMAKKSRIVVQEVEKEKLDSMSKIKNNQGIIAIASFKEYVEVEDILDNAKSKGEVPFVIILDQVQDVYNLGAVIRTANAVGAHGIIIPKRRSASLNSIVAKTSAGAIEYVDVARVSNISSAISKLKGEGVWVAGLDAKADEDFYEADFNSPLAIVIGGEGNGLGRLVKENCDFLVKLPMCGEISSLNASVAAGIVMYEALKQRTIGGK